MLIIGINEGINASVVIMNGSKPLFAIQEERIVKEKEFIGFPKESIRFALDYLGLNPGDFQIVCLSNERSPNFSYKDFIRSYLNKEKTIVQALGSGEIKDAIRRVYHYSGCLRRMRIQSASVVSNNLVESKVKEIGFGQARVVRSHHHLNHAASAYFGLRENDEPHLVLTLDGGGDGDCSHVYIGEKGRLRRIARTEGGHSLGNIYSRITYLLGMKPHEHEYKLMGMAPYADQNYAQPVVDVLGTYLGFHPREPMRFRRKISESTDYIYARMERDLRRVRFDSIAGGVQIFTENMLLEWIRNCVQSTGIRRILCAGGVFMNVKANKLLSQLDCVDSFDVFPSCGDETLPFGAAWLAGNEIEDVPPLALETLYLGPDPDCAADGERVVTREDIHCETISNPVERTIQLISQGEIVARCSGNMEFGARALGNRSLLADPMQPNIISTINKMIKKRDFWMPFAPIVLDEDANKYLYIPHSLKRDRISPYMMHSFDTTNAAHEMAAAVHPYDLSARAQIVTSHNNAELHQILKGFRSNTGRSVLLNTSFNLHGLPIVMGERDAIYVMENSDIKHLIVNSRYYFKK
ncbi:MAG: carbamoyltransferase C-terminal domain-containing protein [Minwuia sp.]|uniref:carbamoyltransferase C-terminal domain-containing protein n=1 Tax=Minwuia sp. TaxID=2493630 RepID=UPI003A8B5472